MARFTVQLRGGPCEGLHSLFATSAPPTTVTVVDKEKDVHHVYDAVDDFRASGNEAPARFRYRGSFAIAPAR